MCRSIWADWVRWQTKTSKWKVTIRRPEFLLTSWLKSFSSLRGSTPSWRGLVRKWALIRSKSSRCSCKSCRRRIILISASIRRECSKWLSKTSRQDSRANWKRKAISSRAIHREKMRYSLSLIRYCYSSEKKDLKYVIWFWWQGKKAMKVWMRSWTSGGQQTSSSLSGIPKATKWQEKSLMPS